MKSWSRFARRLGQLGLAVVGAGLLALALSPGLRAQARWWISVARVSVQVNVDESRVPEYELPDPLVANDGSAVTDAKHWMETRRSELIELFRDEVYGHSAPAPERVRVLRESSEPALGGLAVRKQWTLAVSEDPGAPSLELLVYLPAEADGPVPLFLGLNFFGNHSIHPDPGIRLSDRWMRNDKAHAVRDNRAGERSRGTNASRWPVETILERGYGLATVYYGDLEPDHPEGHREGIRSHVAQSPDESKASWGAVGVWAWTLSRALDHLVTDSAVDAERIAVIGHSRLGKAALWASAQDERFAMVISNNSGCLGAALSRRRFGERTAFVNQLFPHWFPPQLARYEDSEHEMPVDQHMLLALIAPRPLYVASAEEDVWADPLGEFLAAKEASRVYVFLGGQGLALDAFPDPGTGASSQLGYHLRTGEHDMTPWDWDHYLDFADQHMTGPKYTF